MTTGPWSLYGNVAWSRAMGKDINSAQYNFSPAELAFIADNFIHLDHDQTWSGSAGAAYTLNQDSPSSDAGVGRPAGAKRIAREHGDDPERHGAAILRDGEHVGRATGDADGTELRLDVLNLADTVVSDP